MERFEGNALKAGISIKNHRNIELLSKTIFCLGLDLWICENDSITTFKLRYFPGASFNGFRLIRIEP